MKLFRKTLSGAAAANVLREVTEYPYTLLFASCEHLHRNCFRRFYKDEILRLREEFLRARELEEPDAKKATLDEQV